MKWNRNIKDIPTKTEVLILTDIGQVFIAWRNRKNSKHLDIKCCINGKVEWSKNETDISSIVYWSMIDNLTKKQYEDVFEPDERWDRMFDYSNDITKSEKVKALNNTKKTKSNNTKKINNNWTRYTVVSKNMVGLTLSVYDGKGFKPLFITEQMIGKKIIDCLK